MEAHELLFDEIGGENAFYECWAMDGREGWKDLSGGLSGEERPAEVKSPECHAE